VPVWACIHEFAEVNFSRPLCRWMGIMPIHVDADLCNIAPALRQSFFGNVIGDKGASFTEGLRWSGRCVLSGLKFQFRVQFRS
jgi:hypothetical protein